MGNSQGRHRAQTKHATPTRTSSPSKRRAQLLLATSGATAAAVTLGMAAPAMAVAPAQLRENCSWNTAADQQRNIQTCKFFSNSLGREVAVEVRASDQAAGGTENGIYFLDGLGANNDYNTWANPDVGEVDAYSTGVNLVLPAGGAGEWATNWQTNPIQNGQKVPAPQWDDFLSTELPDYLNKNFSIQKQNNAIVGVSMSAGPAIILALNHPDVFSVVRAFSGFYQTDNALGYQAIPYIQNDRAGISNGGTAMWGDPTMPGNTWAANDVSKRLGELKANGQIAIISVGNGIPPLKTVLALIAQGGLLGIPAAGVAIATGVAIEMGSLLSTTMLNAQAVMTGAPVRFQYNFGSHDFYSWAKSAPSDAAAIQKALADAQAKLDAAKTTAANKTATSTDNASTINAAAVQEISNSGAASASDSTAARSLTSVGSTAGPTSTGVATSPTVTTSVTVPASSVTKPIAPATTPSSSGSSASGTGSSTVPTSTSSDATSTSTAPVTSSQAPATPSQTTSDTTSSSASSTAGAGSASTRTDSTSKSASTSAASSAK
ncbi:alpha/beta hydrolase [Williamsia maris]|uniref:Diacylglycerol O-acyltransferase / trehalose O-mycolyltransferase n=1 Tax=Williamsia maris TaxID=72806 RepID=A0ABT1HIW8_9NOCA|nr:alpha/beta hydrolase-fold protein [Williamsia maris]MCP2177885.1 diacylglycerol O-acyltransferase / trehalose O-mycolyltransferase [Williamsia maris]